MGEILVLCPLMNKSTLAYSTLYSGNTKGNWEKEKSARSELTARFALVELRGLDLVCGRGRGAALAAHRAAIHSRARSSPPVAAAKKKSTRSKQTACFSLANDPNCDTNEPPLALGGFILLKGGSLRTKRGSLRPPQKQRTT